MFRKLNRVNRFQRAESLAELFAFGISSGHQIKQIFIPGNNIIRSNFDSQIYIGFILFITEKLKICADRTDQVSYFINFFDKGSKMLPGVA